MRNPLVWLSELLLTLTAIPILVMMVHVTADVLMKYLFRQPIPGTLETVSYYYMVAVVVLPMAFVELTRQSIAVDLFYQMMSHSLQFVCVGLVLTLSAAAYGMLATITFPDAIHAYRIGEIVMGPVNVAIWPARFLLPIACVLTAAVCVYHLVRLLVSPQARAELIAVHIADIEPGVD